MNAFASPEDEDYLNVCDKLEEMARIAPALKVELESCASHSTSSGGPVITAPRQRQILAATENARFTDHKLLGWPKDRVERA